MEAAPGGPRRPPAREAGGCRRSPSAPSPRPRSRWPAPVPLVGQDPARLLTAPPRPPPPLPPPRRSPPPARQPRTPLRLLAPGRDGEGRDAPERAERGEGAAGPRGEGRALTRATPPTSGGASGGGGARQREERPQWHRPPPTAPPGGKSWPRGGDAAVRKPLGHSGLFRDARKKGDALARTETPPPWREELLLEGHGKSLDRGRLREETKVFLKIATETPFPEDTMKKTSFGGGPPSRYPGLRDGGAPRGSPPPCTPSPEEGPGSSPGARG